MTASDSADTIRFEPEEHPSLAITVATGIQAALANIESIVIATVVVFRIAGEFESYLPWAVFAALVIGGISTLLQAVKFWRIGSGHILVMAPSGAFVAICVSALVEGGPATMASLVVVCSLLQFLLASRLSLLRRIFTPVVSGTVMMLIAVTVMPYIFGILNDVPDGVSPVAAPFAAATTVVVIAVLVMQAPPSWRIWSPLFGIVIGCVVSAPFGLYDFQAVIGAPLIGAPFSSWNGLDLTFGPTFWALLPAFIIATLVISVQTVSDSVVIQQVSRRRRRATDFRVAQGALNVCGISNLLCGLSGVLPNSTNSTSVSLTEVTGIAARRVGITVGIIFAVLAFFPKVIALLVAIPAPVVGAYVTVFMALLFVQGMRMVMQDGIDRRKATIVGLAFWIGVGFQHHAIFPDLLTGFWGVFLGNGMTAGMVVAFLMMLFTNMVGTRRRRLQVTLSSDSLPEMYEFLRNTAAQNQWNHALTERLTAAAEETLSILTEYANLSDEPGPRRLAVSARPEGNAAILELVTTLGDENMEDHLSYLSDLPPLPDDREMSFRLLGHYASSVRHEKYHGIDVITVTVDGAERE